METGDSPEPDSSPTPSSPEPPPDGSHSDIILTPPSAFADSSLQSRRGTPRQQIHGTPTILQNCGGTFTIPGRLSPPAPQECGHSPRVPSSSVFHNDAASGEQNPALDTISRHFVTEFGSHSRVVNPESFGDVTTSMTNMTSLLHRDTPSIMATASMMNSIFARRSPSSGLNSTRRTPIIMVTDSLMGNSTFATRSLFSTQHSGSNTTRKTPSILVTDSVMGNSTFGVQSLTSAVCPRSVSSHRTPSILVTNSVMGNSPMETPASPQPQQPPSSIPQLSTANLNKPPSVWHASPNNPPQEPAVSFQSAMTPQASVSLPPTDPEKEVERSEMLMDVTSSPNRTLDDLAECRARLDSFRNHEDELKEELQVIKGQFFDLLDTLGLSHDIYYNAVTPAETPNSIKLDSQTIGKSVLTAAGTPSLCQHQPCNQISLVNNSHLSRGNRMSTPRSTPRRRIHGRQQGIDMSSNYADLVIDQLLAKAQTESNSSKSNSPPELQSVSEQGFATACAVPDQLNRHLDNDQNGAYSLVDSVNVNRGPDHHNIKDSAKTKDITVFNGFETIDDCNAILLGNLELAARKVQPSMLEPTVSPEVLSTSSGSAPTSSNGSSSNSSVPDLNKELVSRMQYYSDFTIDRQKKIEALDKLERVIELSDEASFPSPQSPKEHHSEKISPRCVEGSESGDHLKPLVLFKKTLVPAVPAKTVKSKFIKTKGGKGRNSPRSSDTNESDTSSGTGSMPRSQQSSRPSSHSSPQVSRDRQSARSSSGDHRSSSRGSRCSTHPLASSTFISDPSNRGSPGAGSVYTWSLENSSDENLQQSFLRSEKRHHRRSRTSRRQSKSSHSRAVIASRGVNRPATVIGADSPPDEQASIVDNTLHLTHMVSAIDCPTRKFGGNTYENGMYNLPTRTNLRSSSLPRTSTRIGGLFLKGEADRDHKASSSPELSNPCSDLNYAVSRIGPSNLGSDVQQTVISERSSSLFKDRPELPGKSSTSESAASYHSQCLTCNPRLVTSPANTSIRLSGKEDPCDDILTNSPNSYDSGGVQPPYNSYMSPAGSSNEYTTVSNSSPDHSIIAAAPRQPRAFAVKSADVFKVPYSPAVKTVKRKAGPGGHSTHNVGVRAVGTPRVPVSLLKHKELVSRRKLFTVCQGHSGSTNHAPKILDRKALVRKIKKFSNNFKRDKDNTKIHTLANL